jgi:hypothetical protein
VGKAKVVSEADVQIVDKLKKFAMAYRKADTKHRKSFTKLQRSQAIINKALSSSKEALKAGFPG